ncbi:MAG: T9SS type A sorting domain-containing protein [Ignavibacteriales bacterium]|nr:T9SS type A sorting domain-containing protein [Ignavibacteriales bacterium]
MKKVIFLLFILSTSIYSQTPCPGTPTVTYEGKTYNTVQIGNQCWLKENLDIGTMIQGNQDQMNNGIIEKYCYDNNPSNCATYGGLYQWAETIQYENGATNTSWPNPAFSGDVQGICPSGWHIPTNAEFQTLETSVNRDGNALKSIGQGNGSGIGTNTSGFSALLTGGRHAAGYFVNFVSFSYFWSTTDDYGNTAYLQYLDHGNSSCYLSIENKKAGFSIRCIKDEATVVGIDNEKGFPLEYLLGQNYPNPFNPSSTISFAIPKSSHVSIKVYDLLGKEMKTLVDKELLAGNHEISFNGSVLPSGIYFYKIRAGDFTRTKKMILMK